MRASFRERTFTVRPLLVEDAYVSLSTNCAV
jgi:hypothetical protein